MVNMCAFIHNKVRQTRKLGEQLCSVLKSQDKLLVRVKETTGWRQIMDNFGNQKS